MTWALHVLLSVFECLLHRLKALINLGAHHAILKDHESRVWVTCKLLTADNSEAQQSHKGLETHGDCRLAQSLFCKLSTTLEISKLMLWQDILPRIHASGSIDSSILLMIFLCSLLSVLLQLLGIAWSLFCSFHLPEQWQINQAEQLNFWQLAHNES